MSAPAITPAIYTVLLAAFRAGKKDRAAAAEAGCTRPVAANAYTGVYAARFKWAPAIRDVISGAVPEPIMPTIWPPPATVHTPPRPDAPPPTLTIVRPIRPPKDAGPDKPRPSLSAPAERTETPLDDAVSADPTTAGNQALALHRGALAARARAIARSGPDFDRYFEWLVKAMVSYAESMSGPNVAVSLSDLLDAAQIGGIVATTVDKIGAALERAVAAERKLNPPKPADKPLMTTDEARKRAEAVAQRWALAMKKAADG